MERDIIGEMVGIMAVAVLIVGAFLNWSGSLVLTLQFSGLLFGGAASLIFVAPRIPYLEDHARPVEFEEGWGKLLSTKSLSYSDPGFEKVVRFVLLHAEQSNQVASDIGQPEPSSWEEELQLIDFIEELRVMSRPPDWNESILICYDEETEGPPGEPRFTENHRYKLINTNASGQDWRWFTSLSVAEHNASMEISKHVQGWLIYGGVFLGASIVINALALILQT